MHGKVLKIHRLNDEITYLLCASCSEVMATWETDISMKKSYSEETLKELV
jgi:hypothetical protein